MLLVNILPTSSLSGGAEGVRHPLHRILALCYVHYWHAGHLCRRLGCQRWGLGFKIKVWSSGFRVD